LDFPDRLSQVKKMENRKLAILLSGRGSNFIAIYEAIKRGDLNANICCVISNVENAPGLNHAREFGLTALCIPSRGIERLEYDLLYLDNMSLLIDLKIMIYTILIIIKGKGV